MCIMVLSQKYQGQGSLKHSHYSSHCSRALAPKRTQQTPLCQRTSVFGNGPNTVSESTVSNTELSEFLGPHPAPRRELSEFLSAFCLCAKANSPSLRRIHEFAAELSDLSLPNQGTLETVFHPFPKYHSVWFLLLGGEGISQSQQFVTRHPQMKGF